MKVFMKARLWSNDGEKLFLMKFLADMRGKVTGIQRDRFQCVFKSELLHEMFQTEHEIFDTYKFVLILHIRIRAKHAVGRLP